MQSFSMRYTQVRHSLLYYVLLIKVSVEYTSFSANNSFVEYFVSFLSHKLFGIQERYSVSNKATNGLLGEIGIS